jgi:hypothetical protein
MSSISQQTYLLLQTLYKQTLEKCSLNEQSRDFVSSVDIAASSNTIEEYQQLLPTSTLVVDEKLQDILKDFYLVKNKINSINLMYINNG